MTNCSSRHSRSTTTTRAAAGPRTAPAPAASSDPPQLSRWWQLSCFCCTDTRTKWLLLSKSLSLVPKHENSYSDATYIEYLEILCNLVLVCCYVLPNLTSFNNNQLKSDLISPVSWCLEVIMWIPAMFWAERAEHGAMSECNGTLLAWLVPPGVALFIFRLENHSVIFAAHDFYPASTDTPCVPRHHCSLQASRSSSPVMICHSPLSVYLVACQCYPRPSHDHSAILLRCGFTHQVIVWHSSERLICTTLH